MTATTTSNLTPEQRTTLQTFRKQLEDEEYLLPGETLGTDDDTLLRFLRARKFHLPASKRMITQCLAWRHTVEEDGIDALYEKIDPLGFDKREEMFKYCTHELHTHPSHRVGQWLIQNPPIGPMWFHKTDKSGRPLNIQLFGAFDVAKLHKVVDPRFHFQTVLVNCEALTREVLPGCSRATGTKIESAYCIVDLKGFGLGQFWQIRSLARQCFAISQDYYPETMGHLAIINAPSSFTAIWRAISAWLSKETVSKIQILDSNYLPTLLQDIDAENLPVMFGGRCTCEGLGGCSLSSAGPWLDRRDWKNQSWRHNYPDDVGKGTGGSQVDVPVTADGSTAHPSASDAIGRPAPVADSSSSPIVTTSPATNSLADQAASRNVAVAVEQQGNVGATSTTAEGAEKVNEVVAN